MGDIPQIEADEDIDRDVEIMEEMMRRLTTTTRQKTARQLIEDMKERCE